MDFRAGFSFSVLSFVNWNWCFFCVCVFVFLDLERGFFVVDLVDLVDLVVGDVFWGAMGVERKGGKCNGVLEFRCLATNETILLSLHFDAVDFA